MVSLSGSNKRIAKNTLMLYFRMFVIMGVSLYTSRIILNALGVNDFGIYNIVGGVVSCLAFINSALTSASTRYISIAIASGDFNEQKKTFSMTFLLHLGCASIVFILLETIGLWFVNNCLVISDSRMYAANVIYQFSILTCIVVIIAVPYSAMIVAHEKMGIYAYFAIVDVILKLFVSIILLHYGGDRLILYAFLLMCSTIIVAFFSFIYCYKRFTECHGLSRKVEKEKVFLISKYLGWSIYSNIAHISYLQGINILLNLFFGPAVNAARAVAVNAQQAVMGFTNNFQMAVNPQIIKSYSNNLNEHVWKLVYRSVRFSFYLLAVLLIPIILSIDVLLKVWLGTVPEYASIFCQLILISSFVNALSNPLMILIQANGNLKKNSLYTGNCLLLILPISYIFLKLDYEPPIVFVVNIFFYLVAFLIRMWIVKNFMDFNIKEFIWVCLVKPLGVILIPLILSIIFNIMLPENFLVVFVYDIAIVLIIGLFIYFLGLERGEREFLEKKVMYYLKRK